MWHLLKFLMLTLGLWAGGRMLEKPTMESDTPPPVGSESDQLLRALDDVMSQARLSSPTTP